VRTAYNPPTAGEGRGGRGGAGGAPPQGMPGGRGGVPPTINIAREKLNLTESLSFMQKYLGPEHAIVKRILDGKTPEARAAALIDGSRFNSDTEIRALLTAGGKAAVDVSTDPLIVLARSLETDAQAISKKFEDEVTAVQAAAYPKIGQAVFVVDGAKAYPDATGTLRLSYGAVKTYMEDGKKVPPYTFFAGLYDRAAQHKGDSQYDLAPRWVENKAALDLKVPFDFVSTNDIVGGNSGSAVVNRKGEIVGLIFDGNIQSLPGHFVYEEAINRAVSVDSRAIVEAFRKIYKAEALANEITGKVAAPAKPAAPAKK
ncbi:MAG: S46 family peptidase, partial [Acidobacteria bacterium]|nr:S46 family peptidase [Acidobacteriota bacterium]